mgnify:CR=1 FL=1
MSVRDFMNTKPSLLHSQLPALGCAQPHPRIQEGDHEAASTPPPPSMHGAHLTFLPPEAQVTSTGDTLAADKGAGGKTKEKDAVEATEAAEVHASLLYVLVRYMSTSYIVLPVCTRTSYIFFNHTYL